MSRDSADATWAPASGIAIDFEVVWSGGPLLPEYPWRSDLGRLSATSPRAPRGLGLKKPTTQFVKHPKRIVFVPVPCACGCGQMVTTPQKVRKDRIAKFPGRYVQGHHARVQAAIYRQDKKHPSTPWRSKRFAKGASR